MTDETPTPPPDRGLRQMLTWLAIAFVAVVIFALIVVSLTIRAFGR